LAEFGVVLQLAGSIVVPTLTLMLSRQTTSTYLEHFGLRERPFSNAADLRFVYVGPHHEQAIAHLLKGLQAPGGIVLLTGESGLGKTTTCRVLLSRLPERVDVVPILNPSLTPVELLAFACEELGVRCEPDADPAALCSTLRATLAARVGSRRTILLVDDAHGLGPDVIDQLSALSSLETDGPKLLEIVLIGEPALIDLVGRATGPAASQATGYYLLPFAEQETGAYVRHRLAVAGAGDLFDDEALRDLHRLSGGIPRLINVICDRALAIAVPQGRRSVDAPTVHAAARSVLTPARSVSAPARSRVRAVAPQETPRAKPPLVAPAPQRRPASRPRRRRQLRPWLVGGGLALATLAIGAIFLGPRHLDGIGPAAYSRLEAEPLTSGQPSEPNAATGVAESPPALQPEPAQPTTVLRPDSPRSDTAPLPTTIAPARPFPGFAAAPPPSSDESPHQRRRRERGELGATAPQFNPRERLAEPPPSIEPPQIAAPPAASGQPQLLEDTPLRLNTIVWVPRPNERMVYVNGHKYVEGDTLENGAILEEIQQNGVIIIQAGKRFRLRLAVR
jgi:type II secretory pathway predicted ATPase ExeA